MQTVRRAEDESIEDLVRRWYALRGPAGIEDQGRLDRAMEAVREANPEFDEREEVSVPELDGVPPHEETIEDVDDVHRVIHEVLERIEDDPRLVALSFIDPLRLGSEELGIVATPEVAAEIRQRLEGRLSFDQERYEEIRDENDELRGPEEIRWVP
jgi:hypothetical protein